MTTTAIDVRRKVMSTPMHEVAVMPLHDMDYEQARLTALKFSKAKKLPILILEPERGTLKFRRCTADEANPVKYPEMDSLKIGDSHLFAVPSPKHQSVRMAASSRNRRGDVLLSCSKVAGGIRVTRHPLTDAEVATHGVINEPSKTSKYGLEQLDTLSELRFSGLAPIELRRLRLAVSNKGQITGWKLRCRLQDDGSVLVVRLGDAA